MMKASRPKPKRAPAAKKAAAQKKKHKIFKPRRTRRKMAAKRASKRKPNAQAARKAAAIASLPGVVMRGRIGSRYAEILSRDALAFLVELSFPKMLSDLDSRRKAESSHHSARCL